MREFLRLKGWMVVALLLVASYVSGLAAPVTAAPEAQAARCRFYTQTGGGQGGFSVCDDANANFLTAFDRYGLQNVGYPISTRYMQDGFVTQAFQKAIFQWRPDSRTVAFVNVFDDLNRMGFDQRLLDTRQTPKQFPAGWDGNATFEQVVQNRQALLNERPAMRRAYFAVSNPMLFFGLPTSKVEDMGNHYAIRLQRAVLQEWKQDVPWARAGQVTVANGADIAKELGALPAEALKPEPGQSTPAPQPTMAGTPAATMTPGTSATPQPTATTAPTTNVTGKVLFTSNRSSFDDIYIMNADGSDVKQLTTMGRSYEAHFSADGKTIVFEHDDDIWKMNADGSGQVNLTNTPDKLEAFPVIASDGKIAFLFAWQGGFEIYTMNSDGSDSKAITSRDFDLTPAWSPNGQTIAFASGRFNSLNLWVVNRDGSGLRQVTNFGPERIVISPVFSPDGTQIAFSTITATSAWEIWSVNVDGTNVRRVVGTVGNSNANSTNIAAWRGGNFLIGGYEGNWDPYFVSASGGSPARVHISDKDDKPSDWWMP